MAPMLCNAAGTPRAVAEKIDAPRPVHHPHKPALAHCDAELHAYEKAGIARKRLAL